MNIAISVVSVLVSGTEDAMYPFFSPDGDWVGFFADGKFKRVPAQGSVPVTLCDAPGTNGQLNYFGRLVIDLPAETVCSNGCVYAAPDYRHSGCVAALSRQCRVSNYGAVDLSAAVWEQTEQVLSAV